MLLAAAAMLAMIQSETETTAVAPTLFPEHFWIMMLALVVIFGLTMVLFMIGWRVIDWITPGDLNAEILGTNGRPPNLALASVAGSMVVGMALVLGCTIIGVLIH